MSVRFSVLDLAPVVSGSTSGQALRNTLDLARHAERLGYHRYWLAEHHAMPGIASSATAVLIGQVAAATSRMRVGSGGVMLPNHAPMVVAEQFGTLEALYPGRIDLGLGRAPGTDQATALALRRSPEALSVDDFPEQVIELRGYFGADSKVTPAAGNEPPVWLLGSSGYSARLAGLLGLPFAFAHHFSAENTVPALALYRESFRPGALDEPYSMIGVSVTAAGTDEQARELAAPQALAFLRLRQGRPGPLPTPEETAAHPYTPLEQQMIDARLADQVVGGPDSVRKQLDALIGRTAVDEVMVITQVYDHADRLRSYDILADLYAESLTPA
ncbi:LLM class flavin-dependent oxidoreductase [Actinomadura madurae]|uniref:LLM class flavin-dependent oxidoreductase n=1 Tax=Actinomadura madurae TaxID=1993 RepID=UPI002025D7EB|nr:LLM class flavin-dependent oxidoreductase [Actinomadura madurae]MCP9949639.1 LLM class flavin-dependent oxidoreductase [Actinomadura madurae]MCP9966393.1 LLM class flavin-dependent oxidoreductase [Actinomadura madurae]MCP9978881.1 LLM class flavin-dependent oxidoreductase [Actinomadura madurae]MCQ0015069.1 LLM class flavin-dependent oxidoreductase [Actinomadura madurae]URM95203.1 LLM class flavin-dependent oxidoreductase [Actinomadura madurae]